MQLKSTNMMAMTLKGKENFQFDSDNLSFIHFKHNASVEP